MSSINYRKILNPEYFMLAAVLGLAFYIAFIPHITYLYPLHVDEWVHLARAAGIMDAGSTTFVSSLGEGTMSVASNLEAGFQLFWGVFKSISGLSWMEIFRFFPSVVFVFTVLSVYVLARREGYGLEAALLACLVPSSVGILGPGFLVPVSMGLLFTPLILFLAINFKSVWSYALIFFFICLLLAIHAPSAIFPILVLVPHILLNARRNFKHSLLLSLALLAPFLVVFPWIFTLVIKTAGDLFDSQARSGFVELPRVIQTLGYVFLSLSLLGTFVLGIKGGKRNFSIVLGLLIMLAMLMVFYTFNYGVALLYERGLLFMMLLLAIVGGAGLRAVRDFKIPFLKKMLGQYGYATKYISGAVWVAVISVLLVVNIPEHQSTNYYHMIDTEDYETFIWIRDNIPADYKTAILDPWKATAFSAITGRFAYTRIHSYPMEKDNDTYAFIFGGSSDMDLLRNNGISIVYTRAITGITNNGYPPTNPDLEKVRENVYLLKEAEPPDESGNSGE